MIKKADASEHARALSELGAAKGGKTRAEALSPEDRSDIARYAAEKRWGSVASSVPKATHAGVLEIGELMIPCAVLDDGTRVLSERGVTKALGGKRGGAHWRRKREAGDGANLPVYLSANNLRPFINSELAMALSRPIRYKSVGGGAQANGVNAALLPQICDVLLKARDADELLPSQRKLATAADVLIRGLAHVGIIALVDEATGYQADRAKDELIKILAAYISKELLPWTKKFPDEFFQEIYRLHGWQFMEGHHKRPKYVGQLINKLIYDKLPPGVLPELRRRNPTMPSGYRRYRHHQFLTAEIGNPHLDKQVVKVTTLMQVSDDKHIFKRLFDKAFPQKGQQLPLALEESNEDK